MEENNKRASNRGKSMSKKQLAKRRNIKIAVFIIELFILLVLVVILWGTMQFKKIGKIQIDEEDIEINEEVQQAMEAEDTAMKGYLNIALFGVDSTVGELDKDTRSDTMIIASINRDTKEVRLVSVLRDTYINVGTDTYTKANSAYARGGAKQAINMLNSNLDLNITDFITCGFDGLADVIDAVGGIEIEVKESEIIHLNNYQICISGEPDGTYNASNEPNYTAREGIDYIPIKEPGLQTLNGLQATAWCRVRYVGDDFERTSRQRQVITKVAQKAVTFDIGRLNRIAEAVFPKVSTSLEFGEIVSLLGDVAGYKIVANDKFPFTGEFAGGNIPGKGSCLVPTTLEENVILLHKFLFDEDWEPSETVKTYSNRIHADTAVYVGQ